jgi:hypothetical protein
MYSETNLPDLIQAKSTSTQKAFISAYKEAISKGLTHSEAEYSAYAIIGTLEKRNVQKHNKAKVPSHLMAVLTIPKVEAQEEVKKAVEQPLAVPPSVLTYADFDKDNRLVLRFSDGRQFITKPIEQNVNIEQHTIIAPQQHQYGSEPTGFENRADSSITFNNTNRTFTISPTANSYTFYAKGTEFSINQLVTSIIPDVTGLYFIFFDEDGVLQNQLGFTLDLIIEKCLVAVLYWQSNLQQAIYFAEERHGAVMDGATHAYLHQTNGAVYRSGLGLYNIVADASGSSDSHAQLAVQNGAIADEDIEISITDNQPQNLADIANIPVFYRVGASTNWYKTTATNFPILMPGQSSYYTGSTYPAYNAQIAGSWVLAEVANNKFFLVHIFATNNINEPIIAVLGNTYNTKTEVRAAAETELATVQGLPFAEFLPLGTVIFQSDGYTNSVKTRIVTTEDGGSYIDWRTSDSGTGAIAPALPGNMVKGFFQSYNTTANLPLVINHNLNLVSRDAFTINCMYNNQQVQVQTVSIDANNVAITVPVSITGLLVTITGFSS